MKKNNTPNPKELNLLQKQGVTVLDLETLLKCLPSRAPEQSKGDFGHVVLIGGAPGMPGSIRLAGEAAARTGAGRGPSIRARRDSRRDPR